MPNRRKRRERVRDQRRVRQFVSILAAKDGQIDELKEQRPPDVAIERVQNVPDEQVIVTENITQSAVTNTTFFWGSPWGQRKWGATNVE